VKNKGPAGGSPGGKRGERSAAVQPRDALDGSRYDPQEKAARVLRIFTGAAARYDLVNRVISLGRDLSWRRFMAQNASFPPGSLVLDLGSGTGDMAREVLQSSPLSRVVGVDNCPALLARARRKRGLERARWIFGDALHLPFAAGSFDGVTASFALRNVADAPGALGEIHRILRAGGKIAVLDIVRSDPASPAVFSGIHFRRIIPVLGRLIGSDPEAYSYLPHSIEAFYSARELRDELRERGFTELLFKELMFGRVAVFIGQADKKRR